MEADDEEIRFIDRKPVLEGLVTGEMSPLPEAIIGETCEGHPVTWAEIEAAAKEMRESLLCLAACRTLWRGPHGQHQRS